MKIKLAKISEIPGGNLGKKAEIYEAVHGSAPDIAGQGIANPIALLQAAVMMLKNNNMYAIGQKIEDAIKKTIENKESLTKDLGGSATTLEITNAIISNL